MSKCYGINKDFQFVRIDRITTIASYGRESVDENHCTWYEVYIDRRKNKYASVEEIKEAIIADINSKTDEKILRGFVWNDIPVWLSSENQFNFKAAYDLAVQTNGASLPVKFKLGEDAEENPLYHTFEDMEDFTDFQLKTIAYINQCLNEGWARKDSIDWSEYKLT